MNQHNPDVMNRNDAIHLLSNEAPFPMQTSEVVEVPLLLSLQQMSDLEEAAHHRGMTTGEMVRQLLQDFIGNPNANVTGSRKAGAF